MGATESGESEPMWQHCHCTESFPRRATSQAGLSFTTSPCAAGRRGALLSPRSGCGYFPFLFLGESCRRLGFGRPLDELLDGVLARRPGNLLAMPALRG